MEYIIYSPIDIFLPRKTKKDVKYSLNINIYRNTCFQVLNQAKSIYNIQLKDQVEALPRFTHLDEVTYIIYKKSLREFDTPNIGSIISKFFMDAMVIYGRIPDDNYKITPRHIFDYGGVSDSDYCKIILKGKEDMNFSVNFSHEDILNALKTVYKDQVPEGYMNNLVFEVKDGFVTASATSNKAITKSEEPKKEEAPSVIPQSSRRYRSLSDEFANAQQQQTEEKTPEVTEEVSESVSVSDVPENPDNTEPVEETPPMEEPKQEEEKVVEEIKTNTFGSRNMRRRIL